MLIVKAKISKVRKFMTPMLHSHPYISPEIWNRVFQATLKDLGYGADESDNVKVDEPHYVLPPDAVLMWAMVRDILFLIGPKRWIAATAVSGMILPLGDHGFVNFNERIVPASEVVI